MQFPSSRNQGTKRQREKLSQLDDAAKRLKISEVLGSYTDVAHVNINLKAGFYPIQK
jgi:hypothetical protein